MTTHDTPEAVTEAGKRLHKTDHGDPCPYEPHCALVNDGPWGPAALLAIEAEARAPLEAAAQALLAAISAAEAIGWTWAGGAEWVSLDDPAYRLPSEMQQAQAALAVALDPQP